MTHARPSLTLILTSLLVGAGLTGCGPRTDRKAWMTYAERLSPAVGTAKIDEFVSTWGMPQQRIELDSGYACRWHFSKGTQSVGVGYILSVGHAHEAYDDVVLIFDADHTLREWKAECLR